MTKKEKEILSKNEYRVEIREAKYKDRKGLEFIMPLGYIMAYLKNYSGDYILTVLEKYEPNKKD